MIKIEILPINLESLTEHSKIPISFVVNKKIDISRINSGLGGISFNEVMVSPPYIKDYDLEESPVDWLRIFDVENWRLFTCSENGVCIGGAVVVLNNPEIHMLDGRNDLAMIWDIRVHPNYRRNGIGTKLFNNVVQWANLQGCSQLKIETQNVNVPACKFYIKQGCTLGELSFYKYVNSKIWNNEIMLVWYLDL